MKYIPRFVSLMVCISALVAICTPTNAQQVSPTIAEFTKKARGAVQITNIGTLPKLVSCRAQGFDIDEHGAAHPRPLDPGLNVRMMSDRVELGPGEARQISYDATPTQTPAWFLVTCRFVPASRSTGLSVAMEISSIAIIHGRRPDSRDVTVTAHREGDRVIAEVDNSGAGLARVDSVEILGHRKQVDLGTFLLYPHQKRLLQGEWKESVAPETVRIQIDRRRVEAAVQ